jgi:regulation of enolase protein 1 (concanavalin A-like superfamily)
MKEPFTWLNSPPQWTLSDGELLVTTGDKTDFWRKTEYGFIRDDGHFGYRSVMGDFTAEVTFVGKYQTLYDQAGLMLRLDPIRWVKTGIEYVDERMNFSTVVTNDTSDWSFIPSSRVSVSDAVRVRLIRQGSTVSTGFLRADGSWQTARIAGFPVDSPCQIGVMCCSPQRAGFEVRFSEFAIIPGRES